MLCSTLIALRSENAAGMHILMDIIFCFFMKSVTPGKMAEK